MDCPEFYTIFLHDIKAETSIGIHEFEQQKKQILLISVTLLLRRKNGPIGNVDDIDSVLDYDFVRQTVHKLVADQHWQLQESLCEAIAHACIQSDLALGAIVSTAKPDVYTDTKQVGCKLAKLKPELPRNFQWWSLHV